MDGMTPRSPSPGVRECGRAGVVSEDRRRGRRVTPDERADAAERRAAALIVIVAVPWLALLELVRCAVGGGG